MSTSDRDRRLGAAIGGAILLVAGACGEPSTARPQAASSAPPTLDVARVVAQAVDVRLTLPGELDPYEAVAIYPKVAGFVKRIPVDRGTHLKAGDLVADLDAPEIVAERAEAQSHVQATQAQVAVARAKADADQSAYDKLKAASTTPGVVAGNDLIAAQKAVEGDRSQIAAAEQNVDAAREALEVVSQRMQYLRVTAPFDGVITERNVHPGALVGPNSGPAAAIPMVRLVQDRRLRLVVPVPESYIAGLSDGGQVVFTVPAYPGRTFTAPIARVAHAVDEKTRTMAVELDVQNPDGALAPGTFCQVQWPVRRTEPSLLVPAGAIASTTGRTFVVRVRNGKVEWVDVRPGLSAGTLTEVFGDLQPGDVVASRGTDELPAGASVNTREQAASPAAGS